MLIPCPFCGTRGNAEFSVLGAATPKRPAADAPMEEWNAYVHLRPNPAGVHAELWHHTHGCRQWLVVSRDTRTHEVFSAEACRR